MAFRVAITLSLPLSLSLALATLCSVYRYTLIWAFLFYAIYVQPVRTPVRNRYVPYGAHATCLMPHAPCSMRGNDIRGKRTCFGCAFFGPKWAGQMELESSHD